MLFTSEVVNIYSRWDTDLHVAAVIPLFPKYLTNKLHSPQRIGVGSDFVIGLHDLLDVDIDEIIERVDVLLDESLDFEKSR